MEKNTDTRRAAQDAIIAQAFADGQAAKTLVCDPSTWRPIPRNAFRAACTAARLSSDFTGRVKRVAYAAGERGEVTPLAWVRYARIVRDAAVARMHAMPELSNLRFRHPAGL